MPEAFRFIIWLTTKIAEDAPDLRHGLVGQVKLQISVMMDPDMAKKRNTDRQPAMWMNMGESR